MILYKITSLIKRYSTCLFISVLSASSLSSTHAQNFYLINLGDGDLRAISSQITLGQMRDAFQDKGNECIFSFVEKNKNATKLYDATTLPSSQTLAQTLGDEEPVLFSRGDIEDIDKFIVHIKEDHNTPAFLLRSGTLVDRGTLTSLGKSHAIMTATDNGYALASVADYIANPSPMPALPLTPGNDSFIPGHPTPQDPLLSPPSHNPEATLPPGMPPPIASSIHTETLRPDIISTPASPSTSPLISSTPTNEDSIHYPFLSKAWDNIDANNTPSPTPAKKLPSPSPVKQTEKIGKNPPERIQIPPLLTKADTAKTLPASYSPETSSDQVQAIKELGRVIRNDKPEMSTREKVLGTTLVGTIALLITSSFFNNKKENDPKQKKEEKPTESTTNSSLRNKEHPIHSDSLQKAAQK